MPGPAGQLVCANCPVSQFLPPGTPTLENPPEKSTAPKACTQRTIGVPGENVRRGWTHVVGLVKTGLMVVIAQAAANLRCLRAWGARTGDRTDPLTHLDPEDYGFEEIDPAAALPASTGPPAAA